MKRLLLACAVAMSFVGTRVYATPIVWQLNDFDLLDGGVATGTFTYDADTNTYSDVLITTTAGIISGTPFSGATYTFVRNDAFVSSGPLRVSLFPVAGPDYLGVSNFGMQFDGTLTNAGGTHGLTYYTEAICANPECSAVFSGARGFGGGMANNATVTARVPEPITLSLLGVGLIGLSLMRRHKSADVIHGGDSELS